MAAQEVLLALPAPDDDEADGADGVRTVTVGGHCVKLDALGPVVVNSDGTMARISTWHEMTGAEQQKTMRVIGKRNQSRMKKLREAEERVEEQAAAEVAGGGGAVGCQAAAAAAGRPDGSS
jgi:hypothetical protein